MLYSTTACPIGKSLVRRVAQDEQLTVMQGIRKNTAQQYILDGTGCYRFKLNETSNTILRTIHRSCRLVNTPMKAATRLQQRHMNERLQFARSNMATDWNKIILSDDKKFNLDGPDGYAHYWRDLRKDPMCFSKRNFGGGSLMVWAAFCGNGTVALSFIGTRTNQQDYQQLLAQHLLPYLRRRRRANMIYQQDNTSVHASNYTLAWFAANNVVLLDWPACTPDLNPVENLWSVLVRRVYANAKQYTTVKDLKRAIRAEWDGLDKSLLQSLVGSMPNRIFEIVAVLVLGLENIYCMHLRKPLQKLDPRGWCGIISMAMGNSLSFPEAVGRVQEWRSRTQSLASNTSPQAKRRSFSIKRLSMSTKPPTTSTNSKKNQFLEVETNI
ncbi:unnamed protein product [Caenorhabditis auriculariae]|uniref:Tc1-like transposase DDE domain-containing protein n=1 Tax=Caenorhabditis auriculariae TaxID=2777116 RepID=A0A8S1HAK0_9PELO|nr:unnamed protein product [Caenorhabditis auriculariae]